MSTIKIINDQIDSQGSVENMIKQMEAVNALTDLIADNFNISQSDAFMIALSKEQSLPYQRELKLRSLL